MRKRCDAAGRLPKQKTYADDFFEKFPNAPKDENGLPKPYLCDVYASKGFECFGCTIEDGRKCWLEQYPEQEDTQ